MRIAHNISALNTNNKLKFNNEKTTKSLEKLSSGFRINRAGDDSAGLAISEKMRGQIRGLNMASKNIQDGISLIQTAEGAMNEIHSMLNRIRELSVQSANDTNTNEDRKAMNSEATQLLKEVDDISNKTEFNTKKLLNGMFDITRAQSITSSASVPIPQSGIIRGDGTLHTVTDGWFYFGNVGAKVKVNDGESIDDDFSKWLFTKLSVGVNVTNTAIVSMTVHDPNGYVISNNVGVDTTIAGTSFSYNGVTIDVSEVTTRVATGLYGNSPVGSIRLSVGNNTVNNNNSNNNTVSDSKSGITLQIGANSNQSINFSISNMNTSSLGLSSLNISTQNDANDAIKIIDDAVNKVSNERSKLGAIINRLEHAYQSNTNTSDNLQSAESRIRDTDIAKEMMEFTKSNILTQVAQSMLAQAHQQPQSILSLIN